MVHLSKCSVFRHPKGSVPKHLLGVQVPRVICVAFVFNLHTHSHIRRVISTPLITLHKAQRPWNWLLYCSEGNDKGKKVYIFSVHFSPNTFDLGLLESSDTEFVGREVWIVVMCTGDISQSNNDQEWLTFQQLSFLQEGTPCFRVR